MNILDRLVSLANKLDQKGLYDEASAVDDVIYKLGESWPSPENRIAPGMVSIYDEPEGPDNEVVGNTNDQKLRRHIENLRAIRRELGLNPDPQGPRFDRQMGMLLRKYYPGVWQPGKGQSSRALLSAMQKQKQQKGFDFAGTDPKDIWGDQSPLDFSEQGVTGKGPATRQMPPDVSLGPKKEHGSWENPELMERLSPELRREMEK